MRLRDGELDIALERVDRRIREIVGGSDRMVLQYIADMGTSRGKRLRPRLMLAVASLFGGAPAASLANCAACCELLHTATLIHDDVIDEAPTRRGSLTLSNMYGNEIAVVVGDYLLALVLRALNSERDHVLVDMLLETSQELGLGVIEEVLNRNNFVLSVEKYYDIIYLKTASLFSLCCALGAYLATSDGDSWQAGTREVVGQAPVPVKDSVIAGIAFPATPEDFRVYRRQLPHWRLSGSVYFVTWRVHPAQPDLPPAARELMVENLRHFDGERYQLTGYVVMNDHVHVLVKPVEGHELSKIIHTWKSFTANQIQKEIGWQGPVFQDESWDRIVRDEEELLEKAEYLLNNPVKRWPEQHNYRWLYLNLEAAGAPWHADRLSTESRQARGPVPPALNSRSASFMQDIGELAKAYGKTLGLAFQVVDDLLDLTADSATTGKPAMNDIREGRITLPVIHALLAEPARTKELIAACQTEHDAAAERALKDHLASLGSIRFAYGEAERLLAEARTAGDALAKAAGSDAVGELQRLEQAVIGVLDLPKEMAG